MKAPSFWQEGRGGWVAFLLTPLGWIYGRITEARLKKQGWRAPVPVIAIGNFTAGGAGKTPTALALAQALQAQGERPAFLTRGYGGRLKGPLRVDVSAHNAQDVGDEALLLTTIAPTFMCGNRAEAARYALLSHEAPTCFILDDGLQNPSLTKDISIAVVDAGFGLGNGLCIPAGPLRAPFGVMLPFVDLVLALGAGDKAQGALQMAKTAGIACSLASYHVPGWAQKMVQGQNVFAFAGIGRPEKFFNTLRECGATLVQSRSYPDHHVFSDAEAEALMREAEKLGAMLVTTQKDHVRLRGNSVQVDLAQASLALPVFLDLDSHFIAKVQAGLLAFRSRMSTAAGSA